MHKYTAFTLAEVLITLGIIGIVAEITIPVLVHNVTEQQTVGMVKKEFSTLSQAFTLAIQENGTPDTWDLVGMGDATGLAHINTILSKYLKVVKNCGTDSGCFPPGLYTDINDRVTLSSTLYNVDSSAGGTKFMLADGSSIYIRQLSSTCDMGSWGTGNQLNSVCGVILADINGFKKPNKNGIDTFIFFFTKYGVFPSGAAVQTTYSFDDFCNISKTGTAGWANGSSCTAWVLYNGNMDYRYCSDLSWNGKSACN